MLLLPMRPSLVTASVMMTTAKRHNSNAAQTVGPRGWRRIAQLANPIVTALAMIAIRKTGPYWLFATDTVTSIAPYISGRVATMSSSRGQFDLRGGGAA
jgi:hypothetical protein